MIYKKSRIDSALIFTAQRNKLRHIKEVLFLPHVSSIIELFSASLGDIEATRYLYNALRIRNSKYHVEYS
jgi:hypothetical protein